MHEPSVHGLRALWDHYAILPSSLADTYFLTNEEVPTNVERLLTKYEAIEQLEKTKKRASDSKDERARKKSKKVAASGNGFWQGL